MNLTRLCLSLLLIPGLVACGGNPPPDTARQAQAAFCSVLLAEGADYLTAHALHRRQARQETDPGSAQAREAHDLRSEWFEAQAAEMRAALGSLRAEFGLEDMAEPHLFEETSEEGAAARIEFARDCTASLRE